MPDVAKRNGRWRVRWYEPSGARRSRTFDRKVDATDWAAKVTNDQRSGTYVSRDAGRVTFKTYAEEWRKTKAHRDSTAAAVESHLRLHVYPEWEHRSMGSITPSDVQKLVSTMSLGPSTVEVVYAHLANIFKRAVRDRVIVHTPCVDIELPEVVDKPMGLLTVEQVEAQHAEMDERHRVFVTIATRAGLRPSEVTGLRSDRVDRAGLTIRVDAQLQTLAGRPLELVVPKTVAAYREVPVTQAVIDAIDAQLDAYGPGPWGLVLSTRTGGAVRRGRLWQSWDAGKRAADLPQWATPHDCRHFYASVLIRSGLDVKTVQRRLGHRSAVTTLDTYSWLWPDHADRTREAIEDAFSGAWDPDGTRSN